MVCSPRSWSELRELVQYLGLSTGCVRRLTDAFADRTRKVEPSFLKLMHVSAGVGSRGFSLAWRHYRSDFGLDYTRSPVSVEPSRPPMTDVGNRNNFQTRPAQAFPKKNKHLLRSEVS